MPRDRYRMTEEERRAFRAYVAPEPDCIHGQDRAASRQMQEALEAQDTFVIRGSDRLNTAIRGRKRDAVARAKKFNIAILDIPVLNSRSGTSEELMRYVISDILLQLHACIDKGKAEYLHRRVTDGIRDAKEKGTRVGRRPIEKPPGFEAARREWEAGTLSSRKAAERLGVSHATFLKWAKERA